MTPKFVSKLTVELLLLSIAKFENYLRCDVENESHNFVGSIISLRMIVTKTVPISQKMSTRPRRRAEMKCVPNPPPSLTKLSQGLDALSSLQGEVLTRCHLIVSHISAQRPGQAERLRNHLPTAAQQKCFTQESGLTGIPF